MRLRSLLADPGVVELAGPWSGPDLDISGVVHDSRSVTSGALFCCVPGSSVDGHHLVASAEAAGAVALVVERPVVSALPQVVVPSVRSALGPLAAAFWGHPSRDLRVLGVTGTSGKTTTTHLLDAIVAAHGWQGAVLGTLSGARTTPEAPELQAWLASERDRGTQAVSMEVSSHALVMGRVRAMRFAVAVFTNLSHDHLDFHRDLDDYFEAKATLFTPGYAQAAVVNLDDARGRELARRAQVPTTGYSLAEVSDLEVTATSSSFTWRGEDITTPLGGRFNVSNALAAATAAVVLGVEPATVAAGLRTAGTVPGRFEPVVAGQPFAVLVDYAHKPGALAGALAAAREAAAGGQVLVVLGAGGDRDASKRPEMGEVAGRLADRVLLTSDNPRGEDPLAIIDAIKAGARGPAELTVEPDRRAAIARALASARPGDVVLIAGKGHEGFQVVGDEVRQFDDRAVAREELAVLAERGGW